MGASHGETHQASARVKLRRAITLTLMTLIVPGSAQLAAGDKRVGRIALRIWLTCLGVVLMLVVIAMLSRSTLFAIATNGSLLWFTRWALLALAAGWILLLIDAWRIGAPLEMERRHRLVMTGVNIALCAATGIVALFASHVVAVEHDFVSSVFASGESSEAEDGRYNVLLLGGDSGDGRVGMRPDSLTLASIDAETGRTVLIGLPRNLQKVPFPEGSVMAEEFPNGFDCDDCLLNGVNTWAEDHASLFKQKHPGIEATMGTVEEITGLKVNYYAMINMQGLVRLVNAVGGLRMNVTDRVAIGGGTSPITGYVEPGTRVLTGREVLWFSRSRTQSSDYARMGRQKCVMAAMTQQLNPRSILFNVKELSESGKEMLQTDIPLGDVSQFMDLALKMRNEKMSTISLVPPEVDTSDPDWKAIRAMVAEAVDESAGKAKKPKSKGAKKSTGSESTPSPGDDPQVTDKSHGNADDLAATC